MNLHPYPQFPFCEMGRGHLSPKVIVPPPLNLFSTLYYIFKTYLSVVVLVLPWRHVGSRAHGPVVVACSPRGIWDPSSLVRDQSQVSCIGKWILNHWATGKSLVFWKFCL